MPKDIEKAKMRQARYRLKQKIAKYGEGQASQDMRGRHKGHRRGSSHGKWNDGQLLSSHGYVLVRVDKSHHLAFGNGYAYEHDLVAEGQLGRALLPNEVVHHRNGDKTDNTPTNLEVLTASSHIKHHNADRPRNAHGKFMGGAIDKRHDLDDLPEDLRVRQFPTAQFEPA